jgi:hypothetical protein
MSQSHHDALRSSRALHTPISRENKRSAARREGRQMQGREGRMQLGHRQLQRLSKHQPPADMIRNTLSVLQAARLAPGAWQAAAGWGCILPYASSGLKRCQHTQPYA